MALLKNITLNNGITVKYHRIVSINHIINSKTILELASYTSEEKRAEEINALQNGEPMNVFINTSYINLKYNLELTPEGAYEIIKTLPEFKGAKNEL